MIPFAAPRLLPGCSHRAGCRGQRPTHNRVKTVKIVLHGEQEEPGRIAAGMARQSLPPPNPSAAHVKEGMSPKVQEVIAKLPQDPARPKLSKSDEQFLAEGMEIVYGAEVGLTRVSPCCGPKDLTKQAHLLQSNRAWTSSRSTSCSSASDFRGAIRPSCSSH